MSNILTPVDFLLWYSVMSSVALVDLLLWDHVTSDEALIALLLWYAVRSGIVEVWHNVT